MRDHYEVLGIPKTASADDIAKAYRKGAMENHPDRNPGDSHAADRFKEIQNAYETLSDPAKKGRYDSGSGRGMHFRTRPGPTKNDFSGATFEDVVEEFFGGSAFKGRNITIRLEIELSEILTGCKKYIKVKKRKKCGCEGRGFNFTSSVPCANCGGSGTFQSKDSPFQFIAQCPVCQGTGQSNPVQCVDCNGTGYSPNPIEKALEIKIPRGIESGMQIRLAGEGEPSLKSNGKDGDVIVFVLVKEHDVFKREGSNLTLEVPVSYSQLVLGCDFEIPTLSEGTLKIKIPEGSQSHTKFRIKGKGLPTLNGVIGDLIATVKIETPKVLDEEYRRLMDQLSELEKKHMTPRREQWNRKTESK